MKALKLGLSAVLLGGALLLGGLGAPALAADRAAAAGGQDIIITGNTRSKDSYIRKLVRICQRSSPEEAAVAKCLDDKGAFNDVEVTRTEDGKLQVRLKDQWTLIPVPFFRSGGDDDQQQGFGAVIFESNLAGSGNIFGLAYNQQTKTGKSSYSTFVGLRNLGYWGRYGVFLNLRSQDLINTQYNQDGLIYTQDEQSQGFGLSFVQPLDAAEFFSLRYSLDFAQGDFGRNRLVNPQDTDDRLDYDEPSEDVKFERSSVGLGYRIKRDEQQNYYVTGFTWEQEATAEYYTYIRGPDSGNDYKLESNFYLGIPTGRQRVLQLYLNSELREQDNAYGSYKIGGTRGSRAIPSRGLWGNGYADLALEYQIPVLRRRAITWTVSPFYDAGYIDGLPQRDGEQLPARFRPADDANADAARHLSWNSAGIASYVYFARVAIPAIGFSLGYNDQFSPNRPSFNFIIGRNM